MPESIPNKYSLVRIKNQSSIYFVTNIIESLTQKEAELRQVGLESKEFVCQPIELLEQFPYPFREPIDYFTWLAVRALKSNSEKFQTAFHCNTIFKHYQLRPLLKFSSNPERRLLIADETGLGKTIETGYILLNEIVSRDIKRIIILCPASLQNKWQGELWQKFGLRFDIVTGKILIESIQNKKKTFQFIASIDCIRSFDQNDLLKILDSEINLLVIDEIHHMIGRSGDILRRKFGIGLSLIADGVIGLTATPVQLEMTDLKRIIEVIKPGVLTDNEFDVAVWINSHLNRLYKLLGQSPWTKEAEKIFTEELNLFREDIRQSGIDYSPAMEPFLTNIASKITRALENSTEQYRIRNEIREKNSFLTFITRARRIEVGEDRIRLIENKRINLNTLCLEAFQADNIVSVSEKSLFQEIDNFICSSFSNAHRRQLYSCLPAMVELMRYGMKGLNVWADGKWEKTNAVLSKDEIKKSEILTNKFALNRKDTKWEELKKTIKELYEKHSARKVIVFTQWIPTIEYFRTKKQEIGLPSFIISGQDNDQARDRVINDFINYSNFCILFSTDVMSEGLDLQSADCIINYDLPTNPQRIEQRIGRIDRIGQKSEKIIIINFFLEEPLDQRIRELLIDRIKIFETGLGDLPKTIIEKIDAGRSLDEDEIIRTAFEIETRKKLLEGEVFIGLDEELDQEINVIQGGSKEFYNLRWLALDRLFYLILGEAQSRKIRIDKDALILSNLEKIDIETLGKTVSLKDRVEVQEQLQSILSEKGASRIIFKKDGVGLFLPYFHPLMQSALDISYTSLILSKEQKEFETIYLKIRGNMASLNLESQLLILTEFSYNGFSLKYGKWTWYSVSDNQQIKEMNNPIIERVIELFREGAISIAISPKTDLIGYVKEQIKKTQSIWVEKQRIKDLAYSRFKVKADLQRFKEQIIYLKKIVDEAPLSFPKQIDVTGSQKRILELESALINIENSYNIYDGGEKGVRILAVIEFEQKS